MIKLMLTFVVFCSMSILLISCGGSSWSEEDKAVLSERCLGGFEAMKDTTTKEKRESYCLCFVDELMKKYKTMEEVDEAFKKDGGVSTNCTSK